MAQDEGIGKKSQRLLGLSTPDDDVPAGSALAASVLAGLVAAGLLWAWRGPEIAGLIFILAIAQGLVREVVRMRANKQAAARSSKKRKRR